MIISCARQILPLNTSTASHRGLQLLPRNRSIQHERKGKVPAIELRGPVVANVCVFLGRCFVGKSEMLVYRCIPCQFERKVTALCERRGAAVPDHGHRTPTTPTPTRADETTATAIVAKHSTRTTTFLMKTRIVMIRMRVAFRDKITVLVVARTIFFMKNDPIAPVRCG